MKARFAVIGFVLLLISALSLAVLWPGKPHDQPQMEMTSDLPDPGLARDAGHLSGEPEIKASSPPIPPPDLNHDENIPGEYPHMAELPEDLRDIPLGISPEHLLSLHPNAIMDESNPEWYYEDSNTPSTWKSVMFHFVHVGEYKDLEKYLINKYPPETIPEQIKRMSDDERAEFRNLAQHLFAMREQSPLILESILVATNMQRKTADPAYSANDEIMDILKQLSFPDEVVVGKSPESTPSVVILVWYKAGYSIKVSCPFDSKHKSFFWPKHIFIIPAYWKRERAVNSKRYLSEKEIAENERASEIYSLYKTLETKALGKRE